MGAIIRFTGRIFRFVAFRLVPLVMISGIVWSGYQVAGAVVRQIDERNDYETRRESFPQTATAIALAIPTDAPTATHTPTDVPTATHTPTDVPTVTHTPTDEPTVTHTPTDVPTATHTPTETPLPEDDGEVTIHDAASDLQGVTSSSEEVSARQVVFATNTPRPVVFATNTPAGQPAAESTSVTTPIPTDEPVEIEPTATATPTDEPTSTPTDMPTETPVPTETPFPTETSEPEATATPTIVAPELNVLPTPLLPQNVEPGTTIDGIEVPERVELVRRDYNLLNILLLGTDSELHSNGYTLTDTMIVVSINRDTGTVNMISFPRDLFVYIPTTNGMMQRMNVAYGVGEAIGWTDGGFGLLRQTIFYNFGINVHYYAQVDFSGFREIVDMLGGVEIAVDCAYEDYPLIGAELPDGMRQSTEDGLRVLDVGYYEMNGAQALWYARTRRTSSDFDRGRRQQQLLRAIWRKANQTVNLTNVTDFWNQGMNVLNTDVGLETVISLMPLMLNLDVSRIESYVFIPTYHTYPLTVDGANVQAINYETVALLMQDFYRPPSQAQLLQQGATIAVYNGTDNRLWDRVAAERLQWEGFLSFSAGDAEERNNGQTIIIDHTGQQKGSSLNEIVRLLNVAPENVRVEPDPARNADFTVIIGEDYNSCNVDGVLEVNR